MERGLKMIFLGDMGFWDYFLTFLPMAIIVAVIIIVCIVIGLKYRKKKRVNS